MTHNIAFIIKLEHRQVADMHYITSPNFVGLHVCGTSIDGTYQSLVKVVKAMCRHNWGFEVEVIPATTNGRTIPESIDICDELVVRKAA